MEMAESTAALTGSSRLPMRMKYEVCNIPRTDYHGWQASVFPGRIVHSTEISTWSITDQAVHR